MLSWGQLKKEKISSLKLNLIFIALTRIIEKKTILIIMIFEMIRSGDLPGFSYVTGLISLDTNSPWLRRYGVENQGTVETSAGRLGTGEEVKVFYYNTKPVIIDYSGILPSAPTPIKVAFHFFLNGLGEKLNLPMSGGLIIDNTVIFFPLNESELFKTSIASDDQKILRIPFVEYYNSFSGERRRWYLLIPRPVLDWPRNELEKISPTVSPLRVSQMIKELGYGIEVERF